MIFSIFHKAKSRDLSSKFPFNFNLILGSFESGEGYQVMSVDSIYASGNPPSLDSKYLGSKERVRKWSLKEINWWPQAVQNTLMTMKQIFERTDKGIEEMSPEMHDEVLSFERAFYNPMLIGRRSRVSIFWIVDSRTFQFFYHKFNFYSGCKLFFW